MLGFLWRQCLSRVACLPGTCDPTPCPVRRPGTVASFGSFSNYQVDMTSGTGGESRLTLSALVGVNCNLLSDGHQSCPAWVSPTERLAMPRLPREVQNWHPPAVPVGGFLCRRDPMHRHKQNVAVTVVVHTWVGKKHRRCSVVFFILFLC